MISKKEIAEEIRRDGKLLFRVEFGDGIRYEYYLYYGDFYWMEISDWARDQERFPAIRQISVEKLANDFINYWKRESVNLWLCGE